ncbi:MAG: hypothetical protein HYR55_18605 [Acidobacteria bacterium]|nr:hypothetical protein [Acidobacteriota bacterium]MBI3656243.1 hypothetical protein [Acidobacteriota bacterium]
MRFLLIILLLFQTIVSGQSSSQETAVSSALAGNASENKRRGSRATTDVQYWSDFGLELIPITDPYFDEKLVDAHIAKAKEVGATWVKIMFFESVIEPKKGQFNFQRSDYVVNNLRSAGFKLLGTLIETSPDNMYGGPSQDPGLSRPNDTDWWLRTALKIIDRYRKDVHYWSIWMEPNVFGFSKDVNGYVRLLKDAYARIKQLDPTLKVIMAGPDGEGLPEAPEDFLGWAERFLKGVGKSPAFDIIDLHPFRYGTSPEVKIAGRRMIESIQAYRKLFNRYGHQDKELWFTEVTWPTMGIYKGKDISISEEDQAAYLKYVYEIPGKNPDLKITNIFWADVQDWTMPPKAKKEEDPDQNNGLMRADGRPKKAFWVYKELSSKAKKQK